MCVGQVPESAGGRVGESEEAIFKQKYRLENKQRRERERASAKMCACVCARVRACLAVCV